jgi:membrane-associated protease RseP (regulator of RpoE activity)
MDRGRLPVAQEAKGNQEMEIRDREGTQPETKERTMNRRLLSGLALAMALSIAGGVVLYGQTAPTPPPAAQAVPEPPEPPEPPDPPDPPEPPDAPQMFVINDGSVHLGVALGDITAEKARTLKLPAVGGAIVESVQKDSSAAKAGLEAGDAIMEFDGVHVRSSAELRRLIRETPAGRTVAIKIVRSGKASVLSVKLDVSDNHMNFNYDFNYKFKNPGPLFFTDVVPPPGGHRVTLGIAGDNLTPQLAQYFGVTQGTGVLIAEVTKGGPADKAGLKAGDVIVQVDGQPVRGVEELRHLLNEKFTGDTRKVNLNIIRDHHEQTITAELTRSQPEERRTSRTAGPDSELDLGQLPFQTEQLRAQADQLRAWADTQRQRAAIQSEVLQQQKYLKGEWQQQLQQQMLMLKDQLKQMPDLHLTLGPDDEI